MIVHMQDSGRVSPNYMMRQFDINEKMRAILIHWLIEVCISSLVYYLLSTIMTGTWHITCKANHSIMSST